MNGLRGEQAEPALQAMLERLYEDATSFGFPEERFERVYREVEATLYRDAVRARWSRRCAGRGWSRAGGARRRVCRWCAATALTPAEAVWPEAGRRAAAAVRARARRARGRPAPGGGGRERFRGLVTALRLWRPGGVSLGAPGWRRPDEGRWQAARRSASGATPPGERVDASAGEEEELREFFAALDGSRPPGPVAWALGRFEMGCERAHDAEALSDYLLALRALLDATSEAGEASLALRVAALCAEEGERRGGPAARSRPRWRSSAS